MKTVYILFFTLTILLFSFKGFENENDNPCMYHHVNVINGQLSLQMEDGIIQGGVQVPIRRTYSSYGALEKTDDSSDLYLKRLKHGFHIQGGWNFFPQTHLLIRPGRRAENYLAYVADASGSITKFEYSHKDTSDKTIVLTSKEKNITSYSKISGKNNWNKTLLCLNEKTGNAELKLPDGSLLFYQGRNFKARKDEGSALTTFYTLTTEIKPNGHLVSYIYDSKDRIQEIKHLNPQAKKCFAHIKFHLDNPVSPYKFHITTSDDKTIEYNFKVESYRDYLESVIHKSGQKQTYDYGKERKGIGARVNKIRFDGKLQSKISYYTPENKQIEEIWRKHPENIAIYGDKVRKLEGPLGSNGEIITYAEFKYSEGVTEAKDSEGIITKYYHSDGKLDLIEEYDIQGQLTTKTKFIWAQDNLISKIKLDGDGSALFSKTFSYDVNGNITKEVFYGNLSGKCKDSFRANDDGSLQEAESFVKTFTYSEKMNLLLTENEENGLSYKYFYEDGT
ncbi:MAG: hypothetical protein FJZ57_08530, partial [Chlamydiae bacterium]|nr:hypothetical protein [Chlamydiota bacterium]